MSHSKRERERKRLRKNFFQEPKGARIRRTWVIFSLAIRAALEATHVTLFYKPSYVYIEQDVSSSSNSLLHALAFFEKKGRFATIFITIHSTMNYLFKDRFLKAFKLIIYKINEYQNPSAVGWGK